MTNPLRIEHWFSIPLRIVALVVAVNGLISFAFAMRWEHVAFNVDDSIALTAGLVAFAWLMGWLD